MTINILIISSRKNMYTIMTSLILFTILTLQTHLVAGVIKPIPPAFLLPLIKDKATNLYYTNLNLGNNDHHSPLTHSLAVDLGGGSSVLLRCNTAVKSTTYLPIRCNSLRCKQAKPDVYCFSKSTTCGKKVSTSFTEHPLNTLLGLDSVSLLTLKPNGVTNTVHSSLTFTCTNDANALKLMPEVVNGTIGLGKSSISLPSQLASKNKIPRKFALCLPSKPGGLGSLLIGGGSPYTNVSKNLASTPLIVDGSSSEYSIDVKSIEIAGKIIPLDTKSRGNAMICTLAPYTVLQTSIYKALVREFVKETNMLRVKKVKPFEACFSSKGVEREAAVPVIDLVVNGGAKWRINRWNSLVKVKRDVVCLGVLDGGVNMKTTEMVIGGFQMEDNLVEFDLEASKFSFSSSFLLRPTSCTQKINF